MDHVVLTIQAASDGSSSAIPVPLASQRSANTHSLNPPLSSSHFLARSSYSVASIGTQNAPVAPALSAFPLHAAGPSGDDLPWAELSVCSQESHKNRHQVLRKLFHQCDVLHPAIHRIHPWESKPGHSDSN